MNRRCGAADELSSYPEDKWAVDGQAQDKAGEIAIKLLTSWLGYQNESAAMKIETAMRLMVLSISL